MTAVDDRTGEICAPTATDDLDAGTWIREQEGYWDGISPRYDELYRGRWSRLENAWVKRQLSFIRSLPAPTVLDLGCGTGLGLQLVSELHQYVTYLGVDVSRTMIDGLSDAEGVHKLHVGSMEELDFQPDGEIDVVLSLFSSVSYAYDTVRVFREISRVLAPGGYAYLSVLSAGSLSRIRSETRGMLYRTRGDHQSGTAAPVRRHTTDSIRALCRTSNLSVERITGMNVFSGLAESPALWSAGRLIANVNPNRSHTIEVLLRKPS